MAEAQIFVSKKEGVLLRPLKRYKEEEKWFVDVKTGDEERTQIEVGPMNDMAAVLALTEGQKLSPA